jgi:GT2 family glycosyltransferase
MSSTDPFVSVIVPTYNREEILCKTIEQLISQNYGNYELIIVDQTLNHQPETLLFIENNRNKMRFYSIASPGLPNARNFGVSVARGDIIIFSDDDVILGKDWIRSHVRNFSKPQIGGVAGRVLEIGQGIEKIERIGQITSWGRVIGNRNSSVRTKVQWASGGNSSFRRDLILEAGGFDENFKGNAIFEDVDFSFRLRKLGYEIIFEPSAEILHLATKRGGCQTRMNDEINYYYWFIRNKTLFFLKNFPLIQFPLVFLANVGSAVRVGLIRRFSGKDFAVLVKAIFDGTKAYIEFNRTKLQEHYGDL